MEKSKRLPDAELEVMQAVWAHGGEVSRGDIETRGSFRARKRDGRTSTRRA